MKTRTKRLSKKWRKPTPPNGSYSLNWSTSLTTPHTTYSIVWSDEETKFDGKYKLQGKKQLFESMEEAKDWVLLDLMTKPTVEELEYLYFYVEGI